MRGVLLRRDVGDGFRQELGTPAQEDLGVVGIRLAELTADALRVDERAEFVDPLAKAVLGRDADVAGPRLTERLNFRLRTGRAGELGACVDERVGDQLCRIGGQSTNHGGPAAVGDERAVQPVAVVDRHHRLGLAAIACARHGGQRTGVPNRISPEDRGGRLGERLETGVHSGFHLATVAAGAGPVPAKYRHTGTKKRGPSHC
ncbi:hypothetical protein [Amycolatopsis magusensis]|uniref:hypothetical protein n=1 Tax=Amycolatopsis magusensis TaxID=882444 RepID=UPI00378CCB1D